jgi:hypothetical protein
MAKKAGHTTFPSHANRSVTTGHNRPKPPGKKKFKNTKFGARAIAGAKRGGAGDSINLDGGRGSVQTMTIDIPGPKGRTDVAVTATIRKDPKTGKLKQLTGAEAARIAVQTGDFVRVKGGKTKKAVQRARRRGDKKSRRFSKKLGKISRRRGR